MNDLSTEIRIGADASGVEAGVGRAKRSLKDLGDSARSAGQTVAAAGKQAGESLATVGDGGEAAAKKIQRDTRSMQSSLQRYLATLEAGSKDSRKYWESMADFKGVDKAALRPLLDQLDAYKAKANAAADASSAFKLSVGGFGVAATALTAVSATAGVAAKAMFDASVSAERLRTMLDFSTGGNSAREIEYLRGVTARLGLEFTSTAKAYGQFQAAAKGTALEGDKARAVFESVAKASAVMGLSADDTSGVLLALQQMLSKGTVSAEELRGQLGERLPGSFQVAARAMGVTTAELGKMLEQGQIVADDFLPKFGKALEQNLGGAAEKAANRLDAAVNRFDTAWEKLKQRAGDSGVSKAVAGELGAITRDLEAVTDGMDRAGRAGGGMWAQFGAAGAIAAGRVGFSTINLAANSLNGAINALTGGVFGLRTDLALLPDVFKTDAQYAKALADRLAEAETKMAALQGTGASTTSNPYIRDSYFQLQEYIKELKKAQAEQAKLTGGPAPNANINEGVVASGRAREAYYNQRAKDEEAANAFRLKQAGVPASYLKDMAELIRLNQAGVIVGKEYTDALKKQQDELLKKTGAVKSSNAAANQEQNAYESLIASIRTKIETEKAELSGAGALTESQRLSIKLTQDLASGKLVLSKANKAAAVAALEELAAVEQQRKAAASARAVDAERLQIQEELAQAYVAESKAREAGRAAVTSYAAGIQESNDALQFELSLMGMSEQARNTALEQYRIELDLKKQIAAIDANGGFDEAQREEERARARAAAATAKANAANRAFLDDWKRSVSQYDDIFRRGFADMLNNGKDGWKSFTRSLVTTFKTTVADQIYKMFAQPFVVRVVGSLMGMVGSNAAAGVAGQAGSSMLSSAGGSIIGSAIGGVGAFGIGASYGATSLFANGLGATLSAGSSMIGAGSVMSGLGTIVGALGPIALGVGALYSIISSFDDSGTLHTGGAAQYSAARGLTSGQDATNYSIGFGRVEAGAQTISAVSTLAQSLGTALDGIAVAFGQTAGYEIATAFADDTSEDGAWGALRISKDGQELLNWQDTRTSRWAPKEFGDGEAGYKEYLAAVAKDTRQVLLDMDLPSWADKMLESIGDSASMEQLTGVLNQIGVVQSAFVALGRSMEMFSGLTDEMQSGLLDAAGSIEALTAGAGAFYQGFYSEQERIDSAVAQLHETLAGLDLSIDPRTGDDAKEQFRAAVEAAFAAGDADLAAGLLAISGNFATAADYFEQLSQTAADAAAQAAEQAAQIAERPAAEQASIAGDLRRQIYELTGDTEAIRRLEIAGMNAANVALYDRVQALQAEAEQTAIRADLERQLLELQGDTVALRKLDIASMDAYNVALYDQIQARKAADAVLQRIQDQAERDRQAALDEVDAAYSALQRSVDVQRSVAQEVINDTRAVFETLRDNVRSLYGEVDSTSAMQAGQGRDYITQALASARATGYLPDNQDLQEAIDAVRRDMQSRVYASQAESDYERLVLAAELKDLQDLSGDQLTEAEKQLKALDGILDNARAQVDALKGINTSVMSVEDAIANLANALTMAKALGAGAGGAGGAMGPGGKPVGEYLAQVTPDMYKGYTQDQISGINNWTFGSSDAIKQAYQSGDYATAAQIVQRAGLSQAGLQNTFGLSAEDLAYVNSLGIRGVDPTQAVAGHDIVLSGGTATNTAQSALFNALAQQGKAALAAGNEAGIYAEAAARGLDSGDVDALLGLPAGSAEEWARKAGLPVLRVGTNYVPADGLAYLHEGEAIVPKAYNPSAGGMQSNGKLESLVEALTAEVKRLQAIVNDGNREQRRTANAVNGNPDMPMLVQTV